MTLRGLLRIALCDLPSEDGRAYERRLPTTTSAAAANQRDHTKTAGIGTLLCSVAVTFIDPTWRTVRFFGVADSAVD